MADPLGDAVSDIGSKVNIGIDISNIFIIVGWIVIISSVGIIAAVLFWRFYKSRQYNYDVDIFYQEPGTRTPIKRKDRAGIFLDKTNNLKRLWLQNNKVGLNPDNVTYIFKEDGSKLVTLWQTGVKTFRFVSPSITYPEQFSITVGEEDVNWAITSYDQWKSRFQFKTFLEQYGHVMLWGLTVFGTLVLIFFVLQKFEVLGSIASNLEASTRNLQFVGSGTIVE